MEVKNGSSIPSFINVIAPGLRTSTVAKENDSVATRNLSMVFSAAGAEEVLITWQDIIPPESYHWRTAEIVFLSILLLVILVGNGSVLAAINLSDSGRKTRMNFFIMHLAISDLSVGLFLVTSTLAEKVSVRWLAGGPMCKMVSFLQVLVLYASTFVLVSLSIDRFDAIVRPMSFSRRAFRARMLIYCAWALAALFSLPQLVLYNARYEPDFRLTMCTLHFEKQVYWKIYFLLVAMAVFILPAIIITTCYSVIIVVICRKSRQHVTSKRDHGDRVNSGYRENERIGHRHSNGVSVIQQAKIRTIKMTFIIVLIFILCWAPYITFNLYQVMKTSSYNDLSVTFKNVISFIQTLAPLNSAINPLIYGVFSTRICRNLRRIRIINSLAGLFCLCNIRRKSVNQPLSWNDPTYITDGSTSTRYRRQTLIRRTISDPDSCLLTSNRRLFVSSIQQNTVFKSSLSSDIRYYDVKRSNFRRSCDYSTLKRSRTAEDNLLRTLNRSQKTQTYNESDL